MPARPAGGPGAGKALRPAGLTSGTFTLIPAGRVPLAQAAPLWHSAHAALEGLLDSAGTAQFRSHLRAIS